MADRTGEALPASSLIIGVTGHRKLRESDLPALHAQVRDVLQDLQQRYPGLPLVLLSSLAEGSDQLAAQVALELGLRLVAPLPLPAALYREDFDDPATLARFERQLQQAEVLPMPLRHGNRLEDVRHPGHARDQQYAQAGLFLSSHCHILLALWDGLPSDKLGGTAQVVHFHLHADMPGQLERRRAAVTLLGLDEETLVHHIPVVRRGSDERSDTAPRWLTTGDDVVASAELPLAFDLVFRRQAQFNADARDHAAAIATQATALSDFAPGPIDRVFAIADGLARTHQRRVNGVLLVTYVLVALMGLAFFSYTHVATEDFIVYAFLSLFLVGMAVMLVARRGDWQRKYLDYRALAEGLRVQAYWRLAGIVEVDTPTFAHDNFLQKQDVALGWIRNVMRGASLDGLLVPMETDTATRVDAVIEEWIGAPGGGGQLGYYASAASRKAHAHHGAELLGLACIALGVLISALLAIFAQQFDAHLKHQLVSAMGILSVAAAVHEAYAYRKADKELIKQYRFMQRIFGAARRRACAETAVQDKQRILRALGEAALTEHAEWTLMHRERPLQHSRI
jgi:hypothetical protein